MSLSNTPVCLSSREDVESGGAAEETRGAVTEGAKVGVGVGAGMVGECMIHGVTCRFVLKLKVGGAPSLS